MYTIGQAEEITGVKQHVLRYWEEVIPGFAPKKDFGGRRLYSQKDIETVLRLKHLIYQKKFTIEGARDQIISESDAFEKNADLLAQIRSARQELTEAFFALRKFRQEKN
ncbi:MAG: MerR family transcriptional regulator [Treponema sp.]|nr:MerR family transcriptional regulator [Treponema sp.]